MVKKKEEFGESRFEQSLTIVRTQKFMFIPKNSVKKFGWEATGVDERDERF